MPETDFDVVVIGSGAGGSMAARVLAKRSLNVLVLEKGENYYENPSTGVNHLANLGDVGSWWTAFSNDEIKFGARGLVEQDPLLEPRSFRTSPDRARDFVGNVNNLPCTVGGGLTLTDWKARRMRPADFRLRDLLGNVRDASVVNWPIEYDEIEPFYDIAERIIGVQGPAENEVPALFRPPRSRPFPMPPGVPQYVGKVLAQGARLLGLHPFPAPTGINSRPYRGRPACTDCGFCGEFGCAIGAKGTPAVTALRDGLVTGKVTLRPNSMVFRLNKGTVNGKNGVVSVDYYDEDGAPHTVTANVFVLAASPIESARLMMLSARAETLEKANEYWGITSGLLGKNLMFHYQTIAIGVLPQVLHPYRGRTITHMLDDFTGPAEVHNYRFWPFPRGGTLELGGTQMVIDEAKNYQRGGLQHRQLMRLSPLRNRIAALTMQGEDLAQGTNTVDLDPEVKDVFGLPVPRITYRSHRFELEASRHYLPTLLELLKAAGAIFVAPLGGDAPKGKLPSEFESGLQDSGALSIIPASKHILGVCRMGTDREDSVTDPYGKFWDLENLYCADGSVFPTSSGMNPSLTILALAYRMAAAIIDRSSPESVIAAIDSELR